jgi:hypothetical protein
MFSIIFRLSSIRIKSRNLIFFLTWQDNNVFDFSIFLYNVEIQDSLVSLK